MTNAQQTLIFFSVIDEKTKAQILGNVARHYDISMQEALEEVTGDGAESLLDYVTGPMRAAVSVLWQRHGFNV